MPMAKTAGNMLVVPPFECAWLMDDYLRFPEAGRGCVAFEACADNDVTVVLKEKAGSKHYRTDVDPNYAIVLGSHRNRRLKIEVDGSVVIDAPGVVVSASHFEKFWISINDGRISVGKGDPGKGTLLEWTHDETHHKVQYVGLSSWDKHVGYRNIRMMPYGISIPLSERLAHHTTIAGGLAQFLEKPEFSDIHFCVGADQITVPAHRVVLSCGCSKFPSNFLIQDGTITLPVEYDTLHGVLEYLYTGQTEVHQTQLASILQLSEEFGAESLAYQCRQMLNSKSQDRISMVCKFATTYCDPGAALIAVSGIDPMKLRDLLTSGDYTDVDIMLDGRDFNIRAHRVLLSAWCAPFAKMFTNEMHESYLTKVNIRDVQPNVFLSMLKFMYAMPLELDEIDGAEWFLLSLLLLADQFAIGLLQQECIQKLQESLSEGCCGHVEATPPAAYFCVLIWLRGDLGAAQTESVYAILQVAVSLQTCELLQDACVEFLAKHFEDCASSSTYFKELDFSSLRKILQSRDLSVATEERVLNAIVLWASGDAQVNGWREASDFLRDHSLEDLFNERLPHMDDLLSYVRFALMPLPILCELESSNLSSVRRLRELTREAVEYLAPDKENYNFKGGLSASLNNNNGQRLIQLSENCLKFSHRPSNMKELVYICDGDSNGVIYFAGTSYGAHLWMNPALTKKITVTASSPPSRCTDAKALVSRQYQGTSFAGPCFEGGHPSAWWKVDLGEDHQLICNHYTVRQDGSLNYMRSWSLQGSMDNENWLDLKVHNQEKTLNHSGQYASWPIHGANALVPYRFFRIILTGPTTSSSHPWNLCICYIEMYGYFQ